MAENKLTRSVRLTKLQNYLALKTPGGGATIEELEKKCEVSQRQLYRDLKTLEELLGVKVIKPTKGKKEKGRYKLDESYELRIGPQEAAVIFLSILRQKGSPLAPRINDMKDLLLAALFKNRYIGHRDDIESLQNRVHVVEEHVLNEEKTGEIILKLMDAIKENHVVSISYFNPSTRQQSKRDIEPYGLTSKHNNWYLVGYCRKRCDDRTFRLDLIEHVHILSEKFVYPEDFNLKSYFGHSWGIFSSDESRNVVIKVGPELAYRFKLIAYHPSQKIIQEFEDGSIIVSYQTSGLFEFIGWLLQWGELVEIIEPMDIRLHMRGRIEKLLKRYK